jgi:hypothetical protein
VTEEAGLIGLLLSSLWGLCPGVCGLKSLVRAVMVRGGVRDCASVVVVLRLNWFERESCSMRKDCGCYTAVEGERI